MIYQLKPKPKTPIPCPPTLITPRSSLPLCHLQKAEEQESRQHDRVPAPEEDLSEEDLPRVQGEVNELQSQFDQAVVEKHSLEMELLSMKERLKAASDLCDRYVYIIMCGFLKL
jgi:hypothetical protein